jgi:hypothetical protein
MEVIEVEVDQMMERMMKVIEMEVMMEQMKVMVQMEIMDIVLMMKYHLILMSCMT